MSLTKQWATKWLANGSQALPAVTFTTIVVQAVNVRDGKFNGLMLEMSNGEDHVFRRGYL